MRVTKKLLVKLVNELLVKVEMHFECISIEKSRFRGQDYEGGAYVWYAQLKHGNDEPDSRCRIYCYISFSELETYLNNGKNLKLNNNSRYASTTTLADLEISVTT